MKNNLLHIHSTYSINDSASSPKAIVLKAREMGAKNVTLTDHGTLLGIEPFMDAGKQYGINTIPGVEAYLKEHLILVAKNYKGYQAISYAMRDANEHILVIGKGKNKKEYPIMTKEILEKYFKNNKNVIATSACIQGPIATILLKNFKTRKKLLKYEEKVNEFEKEKEEWEKYNDEFQKIGQEIKEVKNEKKKYVAFTSLAFLRKNDNIKKRIEKIKDDEKQSEKYNSLKEQLEMREFSAKNAPELIKQFDAKIAFLEKRKTVAKNNREEFKNARNKYENAKETYDSITLISDQELYQEAKEKLIFFKSIFPSFFVEVQNHSLPQEKYVMPLLVKLAKETNTPIIAANDAHMIDNSPESIEARRILRYNYFQKSATVSEADKTLYIKSDDELFDALSKVISKEDARMAIDNTSILNECKVVFPEEKHYPALENSEKLFYSLLNERKQKMIKNGQWNEKYNKRLEHETKVIKKMGYIDYHMIVRDFCNAGRILGRIPKNELDNVPDSFDEISKWIRNKHFSKSIGIGPGRGSAAGSLVCYMLGITNIDPIKYDLLFERFLNPERVSMPDIDTDVKTSIRPLLIKYIKHRYGEKAVCSIATTTTYGPKNAIQMAGRDRACQKYMDLPENEAKEKRKDYLHNITTKLSDMFGDIKKLNDATKNILSEIEKNNEMKIIYNRAKLIEGAISGTGVHAGGVIISDNNNVNDYIPLAWNDEKKVWVAQCDMVKAEEKGLLKMDLLGLGNLDYIADALYLIKKHHGVDIDVDNIPFEKEVFEEIYAKGNTNSIFQVESDGMKSMMMKFKPDNINDIIILVAMYRPGPMDFIDDVLAVKHGLKPLTYKTPQLEPILKNTYGGIVYQEQVMQIFQSLAGYSLGQADLVRRAMSKKKEEKLLKEKPDFIYGNPDRGIKGCVANGISVEIADELFEDMKAFAKYAFNKSHAACYAIVSYITAYIKYHYPIEYLCALFNDKDQSEYQPLIEDCNSYGIKLLPPRINSSHYEFVIEDGAIRYGIKGIKKIGEAIKSQIIDVCKERDNGPYESLQNFLRRNMLKDNEKVTPIAKKTIETFVDAGLFDEFYQSRETVKNTMSEFFDEKINKIDAKALDLKISNLIINDAYKNMAYNIEKEIEYLGTIVSDNPLDKYKDDEAYGCIPMGNLKKNEKIDVFGLVISIEDTVSKKGNKMFKLEVQGKKGKTYIYVMKKAYEFYESRIFNFLNKVIRISGTAFGNNAMNANRINILNPATKKYYIDLQTFAETVKAVDIINNRKDKGYIEVIINCHWLTKNGQYYETDKPITTKIMLSEQEISKLYNQKIIVKKW